MDYSIIIPAKNEEQNLARCLHSIAMIDYPENAFEVLVIDNGSTDKTVEVAKSYGAEVHVRPELTISGLRNFGSQQARGAILVFLDADCTVFKDWLKSASLWVDHPEVCCFGAPPTIPERATWVQKSWYIVRKKTQEIEEVAWLESMNMFVRKAAFEAVDGFDESLQTCEDYDLSLRLKEQGQIISDQRIRAVHHGEASSLRHFYRKESWRGISNLTGLKKHGFHLRELPSLLLPLVYLCCVLFTLLLFLVFFSGSDLSILLLPLWGLCWQLPLLLLALIKGRGQQGVGTRLGLYVLLNVYFLARGRAMLRFRT